MLNNIGIKSSSSKNFLFDLYGGAAAAYSLRRLSRSYTGASIRVRRDNDNTEQDIGFLQSGELDETSLTTFVGSNSGYVTKWYDQSGSATIKNLYQTVSTSQPRIVSNGVVDKLNGIVSPYYFDGNNRYLQFDPNSDFIFGTNDFAFDFWIVRYNLTNERILFSQSVSGTNYFIIYLGVDSKLSFIATTSGGGTAISSSSTVINQGVWYHLAITRTSGSIKFYINGTQYGSGTNTTNLTNTTYIPTVGRYSHTNSLSYLGYISEIRIFKNTTISSADITNIYNNEKQFYGL